MKKAILSLVLAVPLAIGGCEAISALLPVAGGSGIILSAGTSLLNWVIGQAESNNWTREQTVQGLREACAAIDQESGGVRDRVTVSPETAARAREFLLTGK